MEKNNDSASEETWALFHDYLSVLTAWGRQSRPKPLDDDDDDDDDNDYYDDYYDEDYDEDYEEY